MEHFLRSALLLFIDHVWLVALICFVISMAGSLHVHIANHWKGWSFDNGSILLITVLAAIPILNVLMTLVIIVQVICLHTNLCYYVTKFITFDYIAYFKDKQ